MSAGTARPAASSAPGAAEGVRRALAEKAVLTHSRNERRLLGGLAREDERGQSALLAPLNWSVAENAPGR